MSKTYNIVVNGYGGEISVGKVEKSTYDYFQKNEIDIDEYYGDWDNLLNIPEEHKFVEPGKFYDCDDIAHESGCEMDKSNKIKVYDEDNNLVWSQKLDLDVLRNDGVVIEEQTLFDIKTESDGSCFYIGKSIEKGNFIDCAIELNTPFDLRKLTITVETIDNWKLLTYMRYDGEDLDNQGPDTDSKSFEQEFFMIGE